MLAKRYLISLLLLVALLPLAACAKGEVRQPAVADAFYPAEPETLSGLVDGYMEGVQPEPRPGELVALIVPHAGYEYSGAVAGLGFGRIKGAAYDLVVLVGPSHRYPVKGASVYTGQGFATPLGLVEVDRGAARSLVSPKDHVYDEPAAHADEHSLEVELPFLQRAIGEFRIVPVVIGDADRESMGFLAGRLAEMVSDRPGRTLLVISTDWSHYHDYDTAVRMDGLGIEAVKDLSGFELMTRARTGKTEACGLFPVTLALDVADRLGASGVDVYGKANSGDATGERGSVVGYAAIGIYRTAAVSHAGLTDAQKAELVRIARKTLDTAVRTGRLPEDSPRVAGLEVRRGAFVTLKVDGQLRGCIGSFFPDDMLSGTVRRMTVEAAFHDRRFRPVTPAELSSIKVEVSVLSPLRKINSVDEIQAGVHGLYIVKDGSSGVLLPQVAVEQNWDRDKFVAETCIKAGLPPDAWKSGADLYTYTAEVFGE